MDIALQREEERNIDTFASPPPSAPTSREGAGEYSPDWFPPPPSPRMMEAAGTLPEQPSSSMISPERTKATPAFLEPCHFDWADDRDGQDRREQKLLADLKKKDEELAKLIHFKMDIEAALNRTNRPPGLALERTSRSPDLALERTSRSPGLARGRATRPPGFPQTVIKRLHNGAIVRRLPASPSDHHQARQLGDSQQQGDLQRDGPVPARSLPDSHSDHHQASQLGESQQQQQQQLQLRDGSVPARKLPRLDETGAAGSDWSMNAASTDSKDNHDPLHDPLTINHIIGSNITQLNRPSELLSIDRVYSKDHASCYVGEVAELLTSVKNLIGANSPNMLN